MSICKGDQQHGLDGAARAGVGDGAVDPSEGVELDQPADALDDTGTFVPENDRPETAARAGIEVGVAIPAGHKSHKDPIIERAFHFETLDPQRTAGFTEHGSPDGDSGRV